ncbi:phosphoribosyltransferase [Acaryochloris marina]|uniref:Phosphoribosyltransferase, putative n=1 Tax=Acaryochloris marina (strain MBIC 11017) TaxID=329726 RepID=A8ZK78_ACAM1|nr:phosphoribosyltransferase family protein [Acaryochloris marina]ABW31578.1 phosphoribosyltransferase, putative [Acaryochloris marina MBIC11017]
MLRFRNRSEAGKELATHLQHCAQCSSSVVLALPRGGVPVAYEITQALHLPLEVCPVRKLCVPEHPELAMGAIAPNGVRILNLTMIDEFMISHQQVELITTQERQTLLRYEQLYEHKRFFPRINHQSVILVDDGLATGATMRAAIAFVQRKQPDFLIVAVPVASTSTSKELEADVDQIVCPLKSQYLMSVGYWYDDFSQITDAEVLQILVQARTDRN